jgi:transposase
MAEDGPKPKVMIEDKAYDTNTILDDLGADKIQPVIPSKKNRKVQRDIDGYIYALRNRIERCFSMLKHSRRFATRYDKTADSYGGFALIASIRLWIKYFVNRT